MKLCYFNDYKLGVLKALLQRVDALVVGGGMAFTFLAAAGHDVGGSLVDPDRIADCADLLRSGKPILVPTDIVEGRTARVHRMPPGPDRWKERSRTLQGIADAMADQWGGNVCKTQAA